MIYTKGNTYRREYKEKNIQKKYIYTQREIYIEENIQKGVYMKKNIQKKIYKEEDIKKEDVYKN